MSHSDAYEMLRRRLLLAEHPEARWEAIANFVLSTAAVAKDLRFLAEKRRHNLKLSPEDLDTARYLEDVVRCAYRNQFGSELGQ